MYSRLISIRNSIYHFFYTHFFKPFFFRLDPEKVHDRTIKLGKLLGSNPVTRNFVQVAFTFNDKRLEQNILGIHFKNPIGLSAGFDKNAELTDILPSVGFGFAEVGSITGEPCEGNPKPRLWRIPQAKSLAVWFGLKNDGCEHIAKRLKHKKFKIPIGISIAKTNCKETVDTQRGVEDYVKAYKVMRDIGSYDTLNISCPNVFGGQPFTDKSKLERLLYAIARSRSNKPIFLKLSPDLTKEQLDDIITVAYEYNVDGFICTNLTRKDNPHKTEEMQGGLSGKLVADQSTEMLRYIFNATKEDFVLIGVGGIFSAEDAYEKIKAGASLVQLITGMIYEGPQLINEINRGLMELLERDGYKHISEAIGADIKKYTSK